MKFWEIINDILAPRSTPPAQPPVSTHFEWDRITNKADDMELSSFFGAIEFQCNCGCLKQKISRRLVKDLTYTRELFGSPIYITSGYRCAEYQETLRKRGLETAVGVSQHELGNAADIIIGDPRRMVELKNLLENFFGAIGEAKSFFHVDTRADKKRRWTYNA